jgi:CMP-N-acetylneuraminic acid synthetase
MLTVFLPCRRGSQRIPDKNIKNFCSIDGGLLKIKLDQLCKIKSVDKILVSSNDLRVLEFSHQYADSRIVIDERPEHLGLNTTTTDELIQYVPKIITEGDILWTHVTSPFVDESDYDSIIDTYNNVKVNGYDSLLTVLKLQGFIWNEYEPISYNRSELKWPMTQNIEPLYEVDSGAFLSSRENYLKFNDRIGNKPYLYCQEKIKSVDIDWPEDFVIAENLWSLRK